ncbi:Ada metal-binding domain-containing protein [Geothrix sp. 21YS21S-2]|uniref:Ada metal-binding domain-containing protein n=1 Tax=Geothrix sp. 21YS21S-2 TaxID=3068893 RepID=UPI0027B978A0|nr:Ada metal-binding domain-containing protein [Geothrix sp. 21YS21S-2]
MKLFAAALLLVTASAFAQAPAAKKPAPAPAPKVEAKPAPKAEAKPAATGFVANKASKVYHKADCAVGAKIKADNKVMLATKADAEKAGYKACKVCKP